jgi:hypothetical protein
MHAHSADRKVRTLERRVLRSLCSGACAPVVLADLLLGLRSYSWQDPEHRIVYEALTNVRRYEAFTAVRAPENLTLREQLPAQATRMGFPDVDWALYFAAGAGEDGELEALAVENSAEGAIKMVNGETGERTREIIEKLIATATRR